MLSDFASFKYFPLKSLNHYFVFVNENLYQVDVAVYFRNSMNIIGNGLNGLVELLYMKVR